TATEALSNTVEWRAEPRIRTGKLTMFFMALSLAFTAAGIIILYLLWDARHVEGQTLNAVTFQSIIASFGWGSAGLERAALTLVLALEAGLLLVAGNTRFLGGPAVVGDMGGGVWVAAQCSGLLSGGGAREVGS